MCCVGGEVVLHDIPEHAARCAQIAPDQHVRHRTDAVRGTQDTRRRVSGCRDYQRRAAVYALWRQGCADWHWAGSPGRMLEGLPMTDWLVTTGSIVQSVQPGGVEKYVWATR